MQAEPLLTVAEASDLLQVRPRTIHKLCREGKLGYVMVTAKERRFTRSQLDTYITEQTIMPKVIDRKPMNPLTSTEKGGGRREQRVLKVSEAGLLKQEIKSLCQ